MYVDLKKHKLLRSYSSIIFVYMFKAYIFFLHMDVYTHTKQYFDYNVIEVWYDLLCGIA